MARTHTFAKPKRSRFGRIVAWIVAILVIVPALAIAYVMATFDVNTVRPQIEQAIKDQTGREISLGGEITWSLSLDHGFSLALKDVVVKNPAWASRPDMARIGSAKLHLDVMPLLNKQVHIIAFELAKTDVQLETSAKGEVNWEFASKGAGAAKPADAPKEASASGAPVSIAVQEIAIKDSRFGMKDKSGKLSIYEVPRLTVTSKGKTTAIVFEGSVAGVAAKLDMTGGPLDQVMGANWPFDMKATYAALEIEAKGSIQNSAKKVALDSFKLTSGGTTLDGALTVALDGARPSVRGKVHSTKLNPADFGAKDEAAVGDTVQKPAKQDDKIFSREPLALDGLKATDAQIDVAVDTLVVGLTQVEQLTTKVDLQGGRLNLTPVKGRVAGSDVTANIKLDATNAGNAGLSFALQAPALDMSQLVKMGGMESAISGKTAVDIALTSNGGSAHDMAAHSNGAVNLVMDGGKIEQSVLRDIAGSLLDIFAPGAGGLTRPGINCMAARYVVTNGLMETKGFLLDTEMTTIASTGYVNLPDERIGVSLFTKPKALGLGAMIPPMRISGDLAKPSFALDAAGTAQKVIGLLTNGTVAADGVPNMAPATAGKNACVVTLDNPNAAAPSATSPNKVIVPGAVEELKDKVKGLGGGLLKGVLGN